MRRCIGVFIVCFALFCVGISPAAAAPPLQTEPPVTDIPNETCLACHGQPGLTLTLANGDPLDLYVSAETHAASVHGEMGIQCIQCHPTVGNYPHPPFTAQDRRDASLQLYTACQTCHANLYELEQDSVHARALQEGNRAAAICTDCHTAHAVRRLTPPGSEPEIDSETGLPIPQLLPEARVWVAETCAQCHFAIYEKYKESVHGAALIDQGNSDVPTCIDCHGVHNIADPTTTQFRLSSPQICARCHTDPQVMDKYGISTQVLNTYVADFHGTTVTLFEKQSPDQETNKPVCYDCHGVHDIVRTDDPQKGLQVQANILARCQVCHPQATINFPTSWLSHYIPSPERYPLVFTVDLFYKIFIPSVLGPMAILVVLDLGKSLQIRRKREPAVLPPAEMPLTAVSNEPVVEPPLAPDAPIGTVGVFDLPEAPPSIPDSDLSGDEPDLNSEKNSSDD